MAAVEVILEPIQRLCQLLVAELFREARIGRGNLGQFLGSNEVSPEPSPRGSVAVLSVCNSPADYLFPVLWADRIGHGAQVVRLNLARWTVSLGDYSSSRDVQMRKAKTELEELLDEEYFKGR